MRVTVVLFKWSSFTFSSTLKGKSLWNITRTVEEAAKSFKQNGLILEKDSIGAELVKSTSLRKKTSLNGKIHIQLVFNW